MSYEESNAAISAATIEHTVWNDDGIEIEEHPPSWGEWKEKDRLRIPVVEGQPLKSEYPVWVGSMPLKYLLKLYTVPYRNSEEARGYQRKPQNARISKFAEKLVSNTVDVPTSILLNVRDIDQGEIIKGEGPVRWLEIDENNPNVKLHTVDGQHRILSAKKAVQDAEKAGNRERRDELLEKKLQFVLMVGAPEGEELSQFYVVNTEAKSVRTDLAYELLAERASKDKAVLEDLLKTGETWKNEGQRVARRLNEDSGVWRDLIRMANAEKADTVMPVASFITSLKPLISTSPFFRKLSEDNRVQVLEAFWRGVQQAMPEPFYEPEQYVLQKGVGVSVLHTVLIDVIELLRSNGDSVVDAGAYGDLLQPVFEQLEGDAQDGTPVRGADFWKGQKHGGAAGTYSSSAGKRVLIAKIRALLPEADLI